LLPFSLNSFDRIYILQDCGIIEVVKNVADGKGKHRDDIRDDARTVYEQWATRVREIRGKPRWKMIPATTTTSSEWGVIGYVLERE